MKFFTSFTLLVVLFCCALFAYKTFWEPRTLEPQFSELPAQTQKERRAQAQELVEKVEAVAKAGKTTSKAFVIEASEDQLNTLLQDRLRTQNFPVSDLSVGLSDGYLTLQGKVDYGGVQWPATISGTLKAEAGALRYQITSLSVTGLPAPAQLQEKAQKAIESGLQQAFASQKRVQIESVRIVPDKLTLRGKSG